SQEAVVDADQFAMPSLLRNRVTGNADGNASPPASMMKDTGSKGSAANGPDVEYRCRLLWNKSDGIPPPFETPTKARLVSIFRNVMRMVPEKKSSTWKLFTRGASNSCTPS